MKPPIKNLIVVFLICSILTSSVAFGLSNWRYWQASDSDPVLTANANNSKGQEYKLLGAGPQGQNLTDEVTSLWARQLVAANPQGPIEYEDGSIQLLSPSSTDLVHYLTANAPSPDILTPPIEESKMNVLQNYDASDISQYISKITEIQEDISSSPVWRLGLSTSTLDSATAVNWTSETEKVFVTAIDNAYKLKVPEPFVPIHKTLIAFFSTNSIFLDISARDPVAALALSDSLDGIVQKQSDDLEQAVKSIQTEHPELSSSLPYMEDRSIFAKVFMVNVAYATIPTIDYAAFGQWLLAAWREYKGIIISTALGTLKNFLIKTIGEKIITWAQGEGVPGYVTNWLVFELDAGLSAQFGLISRESARACGNAATTGLYGDILSSVFDVPRRDLGVTGVDETVGDEPGCPSVSSGFYNQTNYDPEHFLLSMQHNVYLDILRLKDESIRAAGAASQAAVNEALSGRGSLDVKKCDDGSQPDEEGLCEDGSRPRTITPGSAKQELISKALAGAQDIIAGVNNENTYAAIVQVLTQALITSVLKKGAGVFTGGGFGSRPGGPPPPPSGDDSTGDLFSWYLEQLDLALSLDLGSQADLNQARSTLQAILNGAPCAEAFAADIAVYMETIDDFLEELDFNIQETESLISEIEDLQGQSPPATQEDLELIISTNEVTEIVTISQENSEAAIDALNAANELFNSPECTP